MLRPAQDMPELNITVCVAAGVQGKKNMMIFNKDIQFKIHNYSLLLLVLEKTH